MVAINTERQVRQHAIVWGEASSVLPGDGVLSLPSFLGNIFQAFWIFKKRNQYALTPISSLEDASTDEIDPSGWNKVGYLPSLPLNQLGDNSFCKDYSLKYAYAAGSMANGIASVSMVKELGAEGMLGFFGAAGLDLAHVESAIDQLDKAKYTVGFNLIHSPNEPDLEKAIVDLYLRRGVRLIEASAYLQLTLPVVQFRLTGIHRGPDGRIVTPNRILAKISRVEVANHFFSPPPLELVNELVRLRVLSQDQAEMASHIPVAQDITAEADSAGHTDNRPLVTLLPTILTLRERMAQKHHFEQPLRVGAAGGLSTPIAIAAAFSMGAAYVMTGSVNQACVESGASDHVRNVLSQVEQADTSMAPAADMFEMGVKVQVLKRGTMFPMRAAKLYELYRSYASMDALPAAERTLLEKQFFRNTLEGTWQSTREFFIKRDPRQVERAERDPKHKMALVFRSYLGLSSRWANSGDPSRIMDYQVWCGPAMGAFNEWVRGTFLEEPVNRRVALVGLNLLYGAAIQLRIQMLRCQGIPWPAQLKQCPPMKLEDLHKALKNDE